jgi:hypothetical protein
VTRLLGLGLPRERLAYCRHCHSWPYAAYALYRPAGTLGTWQPSANDHMIAVPT